MRTAATNKKIREIIEQVNNEKLIPKPEYQRRLVWTNKDKDHFLDTILNGYPFPEIYLADGDVDVESGEGTQLLVDGLQRVSTIIAYFKGSSDLRLTTIPPYSELDREEKLNYLQYSVAVRDLGNLTREQIVEVFKRINSTNYSLLDIEVNNAVYAGSLKQYAQKISENEFFASNNVFNSRDYKRMGDLSYALTIIITLLRGYFNRSDEFGSYLDRYNDDFEEEAEVTKRLQSIFDLLDECGFDKNTRIWKKADLFTIIVELDSMARSDDPILQPVELYTLLDSFYKRIDSGGIDSAGLPGIYFKAAVQATNDKVNRIRRSIIVGDLLRNKPDEQIIDHLKSERLLSEG